MIHRINSINQVRRLNSVPKAAAGGWWDLDGEITSCAYAYQGKAAENKSSSLINLANPGVKDLEEVGTIGWDINGWKNVNDVNYLRIPPNAAGSPLFDASLANEVTFIIRANTRDPEYTRFWCSAESALNIQISYYTPRDLRLTWFGKYARNPVLVPKIATLCNSGCDFYMDGSYIYTIDGDATDVDTFRIGGAGWTNPYIDYFYGFAFYLEKLTQPQVAAVHNRLAEL